MGVMDRFERNVERVLNGAFSKAFRSEVKPVEIASALRREMDERAAVLSRGRTVVPNEFTVHLSERDMSTVDSWGADALADEMIAAVTDHATSQDYALVGPLRVTFEQGEELETGLLQVRSNTRRGAVAPVTSSAAATRHPMLEIDGRQYLLTGPVTVIGRGVEADLVVDDAGVSRRHLEIRVTPRGVVARDLGSTNGSFVEGHKIDSATLVDGNTLTIGRTQLLFSTSDDPDGR